jgi:hypothetical protein
MFCLEFKQAFTMPLMYKSNSELRCSSVVRNSCISLFTERSPMVADAGTHQANFQGHRRIIYYMSIVIWGTIWFCALFEPIFKNGVHLLSLILNHYQFQNIQPDIGVYICLLLCPDYRTPYDGISG